MSIQQIKQWQKENAERVKEINRKSTIKYRQTHRKKCVERALKWQKENPDKAKVIFQNNIWKRRNTKNKDGSYFRMEDYNFLYQLQQGKCAICKKHSTELKRKLNVDHNHLTGIVRGLLCRHCNFILGRLEKKSFFIEYKEYLNKFI